MIERRILKIAVVVSEDLSPLQSSDADEVADALTTDTVADWADNVMALITSSPRTIPDVEKPQLHQPQNQVVDALDAEIRRLKLQLADLEAKKQLAG